MRSLSQSAASSATAARRASSLGDGAGYLGLMLSRARGLYHLDGSTRSWRLEQIPVSRERTSINHSRRKLFQYDMTPKACYMYCLIGDNNAL